LIQSILRSASRRRPVQDRALPLIGNLARRLMEGKAAPIREDWRIKTRIQEILRYDSSLNGGKAYESRNPQWRGAQARPEPLVNFS
jgi:hypothetical protein